LDYQVNRRAEAEIQALSNRMSLLLDKMDDVARQTAGPALSSLPHDPEKP
jgi:uncharacterized membrane protein